MQEHLYLPRVLQIITQLQEHFVLRQVREWLAYLKPLIFML